MIFSPENPWKCSIFPVSICTFLPEYNDILYTEPINLNLRPYY